jgi:cytidylate kinase
MNEKRKVITIDGLAATGKSSLAKGLADKLKFIHINTGLLYRSLAVKTLELNLDPNDSKSIEKQLLCHTKLSMQLDEFSQPFALLNTNSNSNKLYAEQLQTSEISEVASKIAIHNCVRDFLLPVQRQAYPGTNIIAEGRDAGTIVFPDADLKFFIEVPAFIRAKRRFFQTITDSRNLSEIDIENQIKAIESEILARDKRDQQRANAPCIPAKDAILYQNTQDSLTQGIDDLYNMASSSEALRN